MPQIEIPYTPRNWAKELHDREKRWMVLVLHRRAGKTTAAINHLQRSALQVPKSKYAYIAPTYKQAKSIAWDMVKEYSRMIPGMKYNEQELKATYPNGSILTLFGSENVDSLRGIGLWGVALDENSQQPSNLFSEIISKTLADHLGYCIWLGTPKGKNQFHNTFQAGKKNPEDWLTVFKTIDDSLRDETGETIDNLRQALMDDQRLIKQGEMTQNEFDQEWYCSFEAAIKGAYYSREIAEAHRRGRFKDIAYDPILKVYDVWDLGVGQSLAIGFYQRAGREFHMIDYWQGTYNEGVVHGIKACKDKPYIYGKHFAPHDIRAKEEITGQTRYDVAKELGWEFEIVPSVSVDAGIEKGQLFFANLFVDKINCEIWLDAISQYHQAWDDKRGMFLDKPYHDWTSHKADVHRYAALVKDQMTNEEPTKKFRQATPRPTSRFAGDMRRSEMSGRTGRVGPKRKLRARN